MNSIGTPKMHSTKWRMLETLLWMFALVALIPPAPSIEGQRYSFWPALFIGGCAFVAHIGIKIIRKEESALFAAIKTISYLCIVVAVNLRVFL